MKFRIKITITEMRGMYLMPGTTFLRRRKTRHCAEALASTAARYGFRRRVGACVIFYPSHRIWEAKVEEL